MRRTPSEGNGGFEGFFAEGLRRAQQAFHVRNRSMQADDAAVQEAVQAGAMAGAYAGAVAGAMAGALSARGGGVASIFRSPEKSSSMKGASKPPPPSQTRSGGHRAPPKAPDEPASPQNAMPRNKSVGSVSTASGEDEHDLELELAKTLTIEEFISKSGAEQHIEEPKETVTPSPPKRQPSIYQSSLYEKNTDIEDEEEVDPRVGLTLDKMNNAGDDVNNKELELTRSKKAAQKIQADEKKRCQDAYDKLPNSIKEILPYLHKQALVNQQQGKAQKAFVEYQVAHDVHAAAKEAVKAIEPQLMALSGNSSVDTALLERYSDLMSKVVEAEAEKLKADKHHALEARRLTNLLKELRESKQFLTKEHIMAAQPYFAIKTRAEDAIKAAVERIVVVEKELVVAKRIYQEAMDELDRISQEIHEKRQEDKRRKQEEREKKARASFERRRAADEKAQVEQAAEAAAAQIAAAVKAVMAAPHPPAQESSALPQGRPLDTIPSASDLAEGQEPSTSELLLPGRQRHEEGAAAAEPTPAAEPEPAPAPVQAAEPAPAPPAADPAPAPAQAPAPAPAEPAPAAPAPAPPPPPVVIPEPELRSPLETPSEAPQSLSHSQSVQYASARSNLSDLSTQAGSGFDLPAAAAAAAAAQPEAPAAPPAENDMFDFGEPPASTPALSLQEAGASSGFGLGGFGSGQMSDASASASSLVVEPSSTASLAEAAEAVEAAAASAPAQGSARREYRRMDSDPFGIHATPAAASPPPAPAAPIAEDDSDLC